MQLTIFAAVLVSCFLYLNATLSKSSREEKKTKVKVDGALPSVKTVVERDLVTQNVKSKDILKEHKAFSVPKATESQFVGAVIAYVTPWNSHGYDIAKLFGAKFTYVSPVWLQLKPKPEGGYRIEGQHDIDKGWISEVRKTNKKVKIVPRVIFESWTYTSLSKLFTSVNSQLEVSQLLVDFGKVSGFDGYVVELWSMLGGQMKEELSSFLEFFGTTMRNNFMDFILVIPPPLYHRNKPGMFTHEDFVRLAPFVTAFSLMTYDYSNPERPGPNSPVPWMKKCVEHLVPNKNSADRKKILLGLNFYGYDYTSVGGGPIIGSQFLEVLEKYNPKLQWDNSSQEHFMQYRAEENDRHTLFYPTLYSIDVRLHLAQELGTGVSIWEVGQGLDYFYDLL
ncbi:chitinase domain-containing protein 1-like [Limulus polyphemus]|uniref:Chitinase domain-containing protein 1 n=1 Tax=Limulus polyphemus TaxID=6850 RepID=A0ABM1BRE8_LIMPO|nr:chitinase domain-containing protein 1-like [Limulus polyphemus]XP_022255480.1 chitinase domain-containing protein 1-like [Limulus polyphemus]